MSQGRGKSIFRSFSKYVTELKKSVTSQSKGGTFYTWDEFSEWTEQILEELENTLSDEGQDIELWTDRLKKRIADVQAYFEVNNYLQENSEPDPDYDYDPEFEGEEGGETLLGYDVISEGECGAREGRVRGQILTTIEELAEYLEPIPAGVVRGLVPVEGQNGERVGYSVCAATKSR
jgi:hypothetical protein